MIFDQSVPERTLDELYTGSSCEAWWREMFAGELAAERADLARMPA